MSILKNITLLYICFIVFSCTTDTHVTNEKYFSLTDVLNEQSRVLTKLNPNINKTVVLDSLKVIKHIENTDWKNELGFFYQFDLNEKQFKNILKEELHNQKLSYTFLEKSDVQTYEIQLDSFDRVQSITIHSSKNSYYYNSKTIINLNFGLYSETFPLLLSYHVTTNRNILFIGNEKLTISSTINVQTN